MKLKVNTAYFILLLQLIVVFLSDFISRTLLYFSHTTQLLFSLLFIGILLFAYKIKVKPNLAVFIVLSLTILAIGIVRNQFFLNLLQLILICSNFIFIFFQDKLNQKGIRNLSTIILLFCFAQLFFDLLFPRDVIDLMDRYSGTFIMANNKSRFLMFALPFALFLPNKYFAYSILGKMFFLLSVGASIYLGHSNLAIAVFGVSVILAFITNNIYTVAIFYIVGLLALSSIVTYYVDQDTDRNYSPLEMNYHRFLHKEHGVAAVYSYGFERLKDTRFTGVGLGNFSSRSGQIFDSEVTKNIPKQLIKFWMPLFETKAPYGLSSLYVLIVELGIFALIPIFILLRWLNSIYKNGKYHIRVMIVFLFMIINYNPTFFEFNECFLYLLTLIIAYKLTQIEKYNRIYSPT
jgi:hypothetical protein